MTAGLKGSSDSPVSLNIDETGSGEALTKCIDDLMRCDKRRMEKQAFENLKSELERAFAAPDSSSHPLSVSEVPARNRK